MISRCIIGAVAFAAVLGASTASGFAHDEAKYPDLKGSWIRADRGQATTSTPWDPSKPPGRGQQAPLTPEYQAMYDTSLAHQAACVTLTSCLPPGMPRSMSARADGYRDSDTTASCTAYERRRSTPTAVFADDIEPAFGPDRQMGGHRQRRRTLALRPAG
jgi:hypothetical protein